MMRISSRTMEQRRGESLRGGRELDSYAPESKSVVSACDSSQSRLNEGNPLRGVASGEFWVSQPPSLILSFSFLLELEMICLRQEHTREQGSFRVSRARERRSERATASARRFEAPIAIRDSVSPDVSSNRSIRRLLDVCYR